MLLEFKNHRLKKILENEELMKKEYTHIFKKLKSLMTSLDSAPNLKVIECLPMYRLHPLKDNRKSEWSLTITGYCRLIITFEGSENSSTDNFQEVETIKIMEVSKHYE